MLKSVIAIQGYKNSGKDTVGKMMQYLLNSPKIFHNYKSYVYLKRLFNTRNNYHIVHYADMIKKMLGILLSVDHSKFECRNFKEKWYIDLSTLTLHDSNNPTFEFKPEKVLSDSKFAKLPKVHKGIPEGYYLSIRQLLQYFGTEVMRHHFHNTLWINATLKSKYNKIIIADQRFKIENEIAEKNNAFIVHVDRPECIKGTHSSESELEELKNKQNYNQLIINNEDLKHLFNQCKYIYNGNKHKIL